MKGRNIEYTQVISHMLVINATEVLLVIFDLGRHDRTNNGEKTYACDILKKKVFTPIESCSTETHIHRSKLVYLWNMQYAFFV
jgi:hypothetical protein